MLYKMTKNIIEKTYPEPYRLARRFHELYEITAPAFGYKTKEDTKEFDPENANGRLMAFVCYKIVKEEKQAIVKHFEKELMKDRTIGANTMNVFFAIKDKTDLYE